MIMEFHEDAFGSFGGLVYENLDISEAEVIILGIPYESALSGKKGTSLAPSQLRLISQDMQVMTRDGKRIDKMVLADMGNIPVYPVEGKKTRTSINEHYKHILENTSAPILALGGDHSSTYPMLKALQERGSVGIIWFDAHRDLLNELIGSNYSHGCPLRRAIELDNVDPKNVLLVGTRYMDPEEQHVVDDTGIKELKMVDLETNNFDLNIFSELVNQISAVVDFLYVSIDIDVLDPAYAPGTGTQVGGGMTTSQLMQFVKHIPGKIRAIDIMEVSPPLDHSGITLKATMGLITEILGRLKDQ
ncbi:MAG: Guanidinobutyrase [Candidatus Heimdallarchaeota archaeon LC_2]|nr:MAG: Guanidinobutyrase [Candidatus Heimdallarchaeota archaeon LC_2]